MTVRQSWRDKIAGRCTHFPGLPPTDPGNMSVDELVEWVTPRVTAVNSGAPYVVYEQMMRVAARPDLPVDLQMLIARGHDQYPRRMLVSNRCLDPQVVDVLAEPHWDKAPVLVWLAEDTANPDVLRRLATLADRWVRAAVVANAAAPEDVKAVACLVGPLAGAGEEHPYG